MAALLFVLLSSFPGERIATLPTGQLLESGRWQVNVSHRFAIPVLAKGWIDDPLQALIGSNTYVAVEHSPAGGLALGLGLCPTDRVVELHALWQPPTASVLCLNPQVSTSIRDFSLDNTWLSLGAGAALSPTASLALILLHRFTTNTSHHYVSAGLGVKLGLGTDYRLGVETEPLLVRLEPERTRLGLNPDSLAWNLAFERELGWHNFILTLGSARASIPPYFFRDGIAAFGTYGFRLGFHVLRRF